MALAGGVVVGLDAGDLARRGDLVRVGLVHLRHRVADDRGREQDHDDGGRDQAPGPLRGATTWVTGRVRPAGLPLGPAGLPGRRPCRTGVRSLANASPRVCGGGRAVIWPASLGRRPGRPRGSGRAAGSATGRVSTLAAVTPEQLRTVVQAAVSAAVGPGVLAVEVPDEVVVERPKNPEHGDYATNVALRLAKAGRPAAARGRRAASPTAARARRASPRVDVAGPGFLNITPRRRARSAQLAAHDRRRPARRTAAPTRWPGSGSTSSSSRPTRPARCTSAAPAGPRSATRSPGCSQASGAEVTREYYFNDAGAQIDRFARSPAGRGARASRCPRTATPAPTSTTSPPQVVAAEPGLLELPDDEQLEVFRARRRRADVRRDQALAGRVRRRLRRLLQRARPARVAARSRRRWPGCASRATSTRPTARSGCAPPTSATTRTACWSRATASPTYFAADCAYYLDKRERGFDQVVIMLGADHHGYVGRLQGDGRLRSATTPTQTSRS